MDLTAIIKKSKTLEVLLPYKKCQKNSENVCIFQIFVVILQAKWKDACTQKNLFELS